MAPACQAAGRWCSGRLLLFLVLIAGCLHIFCFLVMDSSKGKVVMLLFREVFSVQFPSVPRLSSYHCIGWCTRMLFGMSGFFFDLQVAFW